MQSLGRDIAEFVTALEYQEIPDTALIVARHSLLDWTGCALAGSRESLAQKLSTLITPSDQATWIGREVQTTSSCATFLNAVSGHILDFDDTLKTMNGHPSATLIPALLALAESYRLSGKKFLTALVAGHECLARLGLYLGDSHYESGFHATCTIGTIGTAAACVKLLDGSVEQVQHAMALAASMSAGLRASFGTECKPIQVGHASETALKSAKLSMLGLRGREDILECPDGFGSTHSGLMNKEIAIEGLASLWRFTDLTFKLYPACNVLSAPITAALNLRSNPSFELGNIQRITIKLAPYALNICRFRNPKSRAEASFSPPFVVALSLLDLKPEDPASYSIPILSDPRIARMIDLTTVESSAELSHLEAEVRVEGRDGKMTKCRTIGGQPSENPLDLREALSSKFASLNSLFVRDCNRLVERLLNVDKQNTLDDLFQS